MEPLRYHGNEVVLFHVLDPQRSNPKFRDPVLIESRKTRPAWKFRPNTRATNTERIDPHIAGFPIKPSAPGMEYQLMNTSRPLDEGLRDYLDDPPGGM